MLRSDTVQSLWSLHGKKDGQDATAWFGDGMIFERTIAGTHGGRAKISIFQEDCTLGDGAPRFILEWFPNSHSRVLRLSLFSITQLVTVMEQKIPICKDGYRLRELIFGDYWFSRIACGSCLIPTTANNMDLCATLKTSISCALGAFLNSDKLDAPQGHIRSSFLASRSILTENTLLELFSVSAGVEGNADHFFSFSVEVKPGGNIPTIVLREQERCTEIESPYNDLKGKIEDSILEALLVCECNGVAIVEEWLPTIVEILLKMNIARVEVYHGKLHDSNCSHAVFPNSLCKQCEDLKRQVEECEATISASISRGNNGDLPRHALLAKLYAVQADRRDLREKLRKRKTSEQSTTNEVVFVSDRMNSFTSSILLSKACEKVIHELCKEGGVENLFIADILQNRKRPVNGRRWSPQVLVFCAYYLSISGRSAYEILQGGLISSCVTSLLKYLNKCSLDLTHSPDASIRQIRRHFDRNPDLPRVVAVSDDGMKISQTLFGRMKIAMLVLCK